LMAGDVPASVISSNGLRYVELDAIEQVALPLYEGRMIGQFDSNEKSWKEGKGRQARWIKNNPDSDLGPQYLLNINDYRAQWTVHSPLKLGFLSTGSATNTRTMIASAIPDFPCGNSVPVVRSFDAVQALLLVASFNSFVFDFVLRSKMSGNNLNFFLLQECPLPNLALFESVCGSVAKKLLLTVVAALNLNSVRYAVAWHGLLRSELDQVVWLNSQDVRTAWRARVEAIMAESYGLEADGLESLLDGSLSNLKGFWRIDRNKPIDERLTALAAREFRLLKEVGLNEYARSAYDLFLSEFHNGYGFSDHDPLHLIASHRGTIERIRKSGA
jgi:hypothetical protein